MAGITLELDPTSEDATNANLVIADNSTYFLLGFDAPPPAPKVTYVESVDTDGSIPVEMKYDNRRITAQLRVVASTDALLETAVNNIQKKLHKINAEQGTLKITLPSSDTVVADLCEGSVSVQFDRQFTVSKRALITLDLGALPLLRGTAITKTLRSETTLFALVFTETAITGDVDALGKLVITDTQGQDQWWVIWGQQSRYYSSATSANLIFEGESLTAMGGSAIAAGPSGASGAGSNVMRNTALATSYQATLSTQLSGGGAHLSHIGDFRVFARFQVPTSNAGTVTVALEWAEGDFRRWTRNASVDLDPNLEGQWRLIDLGQVNLKQVAQGTQRWEGRIIAKSTAAGDDIDIDYLMLVPVTEGSGEASGLLRVSAPTTISTRDEFDQSAGALTGKTPTVSSGNWTALTGSDADDFSVDATNHLASRTALSDANANTGRYLTAGTGTLTATAVQADVKCATTTPSDALFELGEAYLGLLARVVGTDTNNYLRAEVYLSRASGVATTTATVFVKKRIAGTVTTLSSATYTAAFPGNTWFTLKLVTDAAGRWWTWIFPQGADDGTPLLAGQDSALATAGTLASGKVGIYDANTTPKDATRSFDNFVAWAPAADAALFASQSLEVRHNMVIREDSGGTLWLTPSSYEGDYLRVPPAGKEARTLRMIVKASRNDPSSMPDTGIDDITAQLTITPRYLVLPE